MSPAVAALLATLLAWVAGADAAQAPRAVESGSVRVVYWPGDEGMASRTLRAALAPMPLPGIGRVPGLERGTIVLAPDAEAFDSLTGGAPHWSAGVAIPSERRIVLPAFPSSRTHSQDPLVALRHELVHLALHNHLGDRIPRWFNEGYATWASGGWDAQAGWQIRLALLRGVAPPLDSLTLAWPSSAAQARLAYLLSASAVEFLARRGDERAFAAFLATWRRDGSFDDAFRSTYLITFGRFEREWREMVRSRYGWLLALAQVGVFWGVMTALLLALGTLRRRRNREKMEGMREEERLAPPEESPAPWAADRVEGRPLAELPAADPGVDDPPRPG